MTARTFKARRHEARRLDDSEAEARILETHTRLAKGPTRTAILPELRRALPEIPRTTFDRCLRRLWRKGILLLGKAVYLWELSQDDREACLTNHEGTPLLYVSRSAP
jgi:hypothetical protein